MATTRSRITADEKKALVNFGLSLHTSWLTPEQERLERKGYLRVRRGAGLHSMIVDVTPRGERAAERWLPGLAARELRELTREGLEALLARRPHPELEARGLGFRPAGRPVRWVPNKVARAVIDLAGAGE